MTAHVNEIVVDRLEGHGFKRHDYGGFVLFAGGGADESGKFGIHVTVYPDGQVKGKLVRGLGDSRDLTVDEIGNVVGFGGII